MLVPSSSLDTCRCYPLVLRARECKLPSEFCRVVAMPLECWLRPRRPAPLLSAGVLLNKHRHTQRRFETVLQIAAYKILQETQVLLSCCFVTCTSEFACFAAISLISGSHHDHRACAARASRASRHRFLSARPRPSNSPGTSRAAACQVGKSP